MPWVKLDTGFFTNPRALAAGRDGRDLYLAGLCWSAQQETDGTIPAHALPLIAMLAGVPDADQTASRLAETGLWENSPAGWVIHNYAEWQITRADRDQWRTKERQRKQKTRQASKDPDEPSDADVVREVSHRDTAGTPRGFRTDSAHRREERRTEETHHHPHPAGPPTHDDDDRPTQALTVLAELLARRNGARAPSNYAATIIRQADQLPALTTLAHTYPAHTPEQLAHRYLDDPTPPPDPCHHCRALTHPTHRCPTQDTTP